MFYPKSVGILHVLYPYVLYLLHAFSVEENLKFDLEVAEFAMKHDFPSFGVFPDLSWYYGLFHFLLFPRMPA